MNYLQTNGLTTKQQLQLYKMSMVTYTYWLDNTKTQSFNFMRYIKRIPKEVSVWFELNFPPKKGFTFRYYAYNNGTTKYYGCEVCLKGKFYHNATQASLEWFAKNINLKRY